jgi:hypothetical protein
MRDTDLHDNDVRTTGRPMRRAGSWVAPLIILALVVGVGWWVLDRARNDDSVLDTPAATDLGTGTGATGTATQTATGTVNQIDAARRTVTLDNGDTFTLATNVSNAESLTPGQRVTLTYRLDNNQRIVQSVAAAAGALTPAPTGNVTPGITPNPTTAPNLPPRATP